MMNAIKNIATIGTALAIAYSSTIFFNWLINDYEIHTDSKTYHQVCKPDDIFVPFSTYTCLTRRTNEIGKPISDEVRIVAFFRGSEVYQDYNRGNFSKYDGKVDQKSVFSSGELESSLFRISPFRDFDKGFQAEFKEADEVFNEAKERLEEHLTRPVVFDS